MAPGLPARMVILCAVFTGVGTSRADNERKKVAVIDLSGDPAAEKLRGELYGELLTHWALQALSLPAIDGYLQGTLEDTDRERIDRARTHRDAAATAVLEPDYKTARDEALKGQEDLLAAKPTPAWLSLFADLELARAAADLIPLPSDAARRFAFAYRLNPQKVLDPARDAQEIVDAFEAAKRAPVTLVPLDVRGTGHVWIDGKDLGPAPGTFEVAVGDHVVQLVGPARETVGIEVTAPRAPVEIADAPATIELQIKRNRLALSRVPDAAARAAVMNQLAELLGVHDAVLIGKNDDGQLTTQAWRDHECPQCPSADPGFSAIRVHRNEKPIDVLAPLSPPKPPEVPKQIPFIVPPIVETPWYRERWIQGSVAGGAVVAIVGIVLWVRRDQYTFINTNLQSKQ